jgi:hypothetical protein
LVYERSTPEFQASNLATFNSDQGSDGFVTSVEKSLSNWLESNPSFRQLDTPIFSFAEQMDCRKILKLFGLST